MMYSLKMIVLRMKRIYGPRTFILVTLDLKITEKILIFYYHKFIYKCNIDSGMGTLRYIYATKRMLLVMSITLTRSSQSS